MHTKTKETLTADFVKQYCSGNDIRQSVANAIGRGDTIGYVIDVCITDFEESFMFTEDFTREHAKAVIRSSLRTCNPNDKKFNAKKYGRSYRQCMTHSKILALLLLTLMPLLSCGNVVRVLEDQKRLDGGQLPRIEHSDYVDLQPGLYKMNVHYRDITAWNKDGTIPYIETYLPYGIVSEDCLSVLAYPVEDILERRVEIIKLCESHVVRIYLHPQPNVFNDAGEQNIPIKLSVSSVSFFPEVIVKITNKIGVRSDIKQTFYEYEGELIEILTRRNPM